MTRFQRLTAGAIAATYALVIVGVAVRATGSGLGCPDWPLCYGLLLPPPGDAHAWIEWVHRFVAVGLGLLVLGVAGLALVDHRNRRSILWASVGALVLVGFQAWLGRETVRLGNTGASVTAHLAAAMALVGLLEFVFIRSFYVDRKRGSGSSLRFTLVATFGAAATFALLLFGSNVTGEGAALVFPDWPLMGGALLPPLDDSAAVTHALHRYVALVVGVVVVGIVLLAWRHHRHDRPTLWLAIGAGLLYPIQSLVGAVQVWSGLAPWTQIAHLAIGALVWGAMAGLTVVSYHEARTAPLPWGGSGSDTHGTSAGDRGVRRPSGRRETLSAYLALTKPRIIELLLVTTVPAMILAGHAIPRLDLLFWTLLGGSLAAGSANAINCYLDRDIDSIMIRTRRRPLPAHEVEPHEALLFGVALGVVAIGLLAFFVNLLAAFLTLLAIAFYVLVYTMVMKRTTPQNIVIGGAAGALPPVIGWAAVTGRIEVPALLLFALVFYWTPPHFWALSLRIAKDYAAAGVPMLPVVRGVAETTKQIGLYSILLVAISLVLFAVAPMGLIYLVSATVLGAMLLRQAYVLWRQGLADWPATGQAIRLYKYSITYLGLLFAAVAVDALVVIPLA